MGERTSHPAGSFSWIDLQTDDLERAKRFYGDLFGWSYDDIPIGDGAVYSMANVQGKRVAGLGVRQGPGIPPHWNCYVTVADVDATAARAGELGANVVAPPFDVMEAGRMAAFLDPQGAPLSIWQAKESIGAQLVNVPGTLTWNDLMSSDIAGSSDFYTALFGWEVTEIEGAQGQYFSISNDGRINGGIMATPPGGHPVWNLYLAVEDADAAVEKATSLGADTIMGATDVPNGTRFAVLRDPGGAVFSVAAGEMDD